MESPATIFKCVAFWVGQQKREGGSLRAIIFCIAADTKNGDIILKATVRNV